MKNAKTTKTTTTTARKATVKAAVVLCSKCGRDNNRPGSAHDGDCRNTAACRARVAIVREAIAAGASL